MAPLDSAESETLEDGSSQSVEDIKDSNPDPGPANTDSGANADGESQSDAVVVDPVGACCGVGGGCTAYEGECESEAWKPGSCADAGCPEPELDGGLLHPVVPAWISMLRSAQVKGVPKPGAMCSETECGQRAPVAVVFRVVV